ncbi:MAG: hypothetical protein HKO02_11130 [Hyphomonadaceae bacterium]|nr:hypothetical protein [Hyphomonadaceae bacterium]
MSDTTSYPLSLSQNILRWLSFISLTYLAYMTFSFVFVARLEGSGIVVNIGLITLALCLAAFYLFTALRQLYRQRRRLVVIVTVFVTACFLGQIWFLKALEARIIELRDPTMGAMEPLYPISMMLLLSLPWYLPLLFPWIANFRKLPKPQVI